MYMKKIFSLILMGLALTAGTTSCMDDWDDADVKGYSIFAKDIDTTGCYISISSLKDKYCKSSARATYARNSSNWENKISSKLVTEGIVISNDGPWGALYQQIVLREPGTGKEGPCIVLSIKNTCLYPYFPIGQRIRVQLEGLYVGAYSKTPKIGYPYFTSKGNHSLGPIPFEMCGTNVMAIGDPDPNSADCQFWDRSDKDGNDWLATRNNQNYQYSPMYVRVRGTFIGANDVDILAPNDPTIYDDGYGVDRYVKLTHRGNITVRTSTQNEISNIVMPKDKEVELTGIMTYYDGWQLQIRDTSDFTIIK